MRRGRTPLAPIVLLGLLASAAFADEARWSRPVEVARPGTVVIELDGRTAERAEIDLDLIGPGGESMNFEIYRGVSAERSVRLTRVRPGAAGWLVELDAGPTPPRHDRLRFALAKETAADEVLLEGGDSSGGWRELTRGSLFRLGASEKEQNFELAYKPTEIRLLRLTWPREAGLPELLETKILAAPAEGELYPVPFDCSSEGKVVDCTFKASAECSDLEVELEPRNEPLVYRFYAACEGKWVGKDEGERRQHGHLDFSLDCGSVRRLRLQSAVPPRVKGATCRGGNHLSFKATTAGTHRLVYGRLTTFDPHASRDLPPEPDAPATLGTEVEGPAPEWPQAVEPGAPIKGKFQRSWPVEKSSTRGQLVALSLPGELGRLADGRGSLRIDAGGLQLPFVSTTAPAPEKLLATTLRPVPVAGAPGKSRAEIHVVGTGDRVELKLFAAGPFERQVRFERIARRRRSQEPEEAASPALWSCTSSLAGGCELWTTLFLGWHDTDTPDFFVEFADGDNPPLREIEAELWATRTVFYFVDPGVPLVLRWDRDLGNPDYDFKRLEYVLPHHEAAVATLGKELAGGSAEAPRWLLLTVIAAAAIVLLAVLARILRQGPV